MEYKCEYSIKNKQFIEIKVMRDIDLKNDYERKLINFLINEIKNKKNLNILEFGVRKGISTKMFLNLVNDNGGNVFSVDVDDYSNLFNDKNWNFIHCRDDNYEKIENIIPKELDVIYLDSYHEPNHVEKILRYYYPKLKVGGLYIIDDICWIPYVKNNYRDDFGCEIANLDTYKRLLSIFYKNNTNFDLEFSFVGSGLAKIIKKSDSSLDKTYKIPSRNLSIKNLIKKIVKS